MSAPMRKPRTDQVEPVQIRGEKFYVSSEKATAVLVLLKEAITLDNGSVSADDVFKDLHTKYTKHGSALRGARLKEDMTQIELAHKLGIMQSDLSKMEHGRRPIGKKMAKRLAKILNIDYRIFL